MLSSSTSLSLYGGYIRLESCIDLKDKDEEELSLRNGGGGSGERRGPDTKKKEFPQLMLRLNLLSHMPWVMKMYYSSDG